MGWLQDIRHLSGNFVVLLTVVTGNCEDHEIGCDTMFFGRQSIHVKEGSRIPVIWLQRDRKNRCNHRNDHTERL